MKCCQLVYSYVNGTFPFSPQCLLFLRSRMWDCSRKLETVWGPLGKTIVMAKVYRAASTDEPRILRRAQVRDPVLRESNIHNRHGIDLFTEVFQPHFPQEIVLGVPWLFWHSSNVWLRPNQECQCFQAPSRLWAKFCCVTCISDVVSCKPLSHERRF